MNHSVPRPIESAAIPEQQHDETVAGTSAKRRSRLASLGAYGFEAQEPIILAALVTGDPMLLIGRSGTGMTFLLNSISQALGLAHRHYNASLISFDDLVGFPYPDDEKTTVRFLETPATIWGAESVLIDEISRCRPEKGLVQAVVAEAHPGDEVVHIRGTGHAFTAVEAGFSCRSRNGRRTTSSDVRSAPNRNASSSASGSLFMRATITAHSR